MLADRPLAGRSRAVLFATLQRRFHCRAATTSQRRGSTPQRCTPVPPGKALRRRDPRRAPAPWRDRGAAKKTSGLLARTHFRRDAPRPGRCLPPHNMGHGTSVGTASLGSAPTNTRTRLTRQPRTRREKPRVIFKFPSGPSNGRAMSLWCRMNRIGIFVFIPQYAWALSAIALAQSLNEPHYLTAYHCRQIPCLSSSSSCQHSASKQHGAPNVLFGLRRGAFRRPPSRWPFIESHSPSYHVARTHAPGLSVAGLLCVCELFEPGSPITSHWASRYRNAQSFTKPNRPVVAAAARMPPLTAVVPK